MILASQSPRRRELLAAAGFQFKVRARPVAEIRGPREKPKEYVRRLAREKAQASWEMGNPPALDVTGSGGAPAEVVLGADTVVVIGSEVLEKPRDEREAVSMLRMLAGKEHEVITGICLLHAAGTIVDTSVTTVRFSKLNAAEIQAYVASGEPMDKAGGYAIQGLASKFVESVEGCYFNVVGLPVSLVYRHWKALWEQQTIR